MGTELYYYFIPSLAILYIALIPFYSNIRIAHNSVLLKNNNYWLLFIKFAVLIFCVFGAFGGDWFSYQKEINYIASRPEMTQHWHMEKLYVWIINNITHYNYLLFRILIWTVSILTLSKGLQRLKMDNITTWSCFIVLSVIVSYSVGRGSLGFSLIIWGYSYLLIPGRNKLLSYTKGVILLSLSLFCHKSMFLLAPLTLISFINFNIKRTLLVACILPVIIVLFRNYILMRLFSGEETTGSNYFTMEQNKYGIGMNLWKYSYYFVIFTFIGIAYKYIILDRKQCPLYIRRILNFVLLIFLEYIVIYFAFTYNGIGSDDIAWRIFAMLNIPLPILVSYLLSNWKPKTPIYLFHMFNFACIMSVYFLLYNAYTIY